MKKIVVRVEAREHLRESRQWYEERSPGRGSLFLRQFRFLARRISEFPDSFPQSGESERRAFMGTYPFWVYYLIEADRIVVLAVLHASRRPRR